MAATIAPTVVSSWWAGRTTLTRAPPLARASSRAVHWSAVKELRRTHRRTSSLMPRPLWPAVECPAPAEGTRRTDA